MVDPPALLPLLTSSPLCLYNFSWCTKYFLPHPDLFIFAIYCWGYFSSNTSLNYNYWYYRDRRAWTEAIGGWEYLWGDPPEIILARRARYALAIVNKWIVSRHSTNLLHKHDVWHWPNIIGPLTDIVPNYDLYSLDRPLNCKRNNWDALVIGLVYQISRHF